MSAIDRRAWGLATLLLSSPLHADPPPQAQPPAAPAPMADPLTQELEREFREAAADPRARAAAPSSAGVDALVPSIRIERYTLANGLDVVLSPGGSERQVAVYVTYHVGSGDCPPERVALAHLAEHLSYRHTRHAPEGLLLETERADATYYNGLTGVDQTVYFAVAPAGSLERLLWVESERMAFALDGVDADALAHERHVVTNEYHQRTTASRLGDLRHAMARELYPAGHLQRVPYALPEAIAAVTLDDVRAFLRDVYVPANASLTVVGSFDPAQARASIERYFGPVARARAPGHPNPGGVVRLSNERVMRYRLPTDRDTVIVAWPTPPLRQPGDADLDVVAALLASGSGGGLLRELLVDTGVASSVAARQASDDDSSLFSIEVDLQQGHTADAALDAVDRALVQLRREAPPAPRVVAVVREWERHTVEVGRDLAARAGQIAAWPDERDPGLFRTDLSRYRAVRPETVRAAVERWLPLDRRLVVLVERSPNAPVGGVVESVRSR